MPDHYFWDKCKKCQGRNFDTIGHTADYPRQPPYETLGYIVIRCANCGTNHIYDEAGKLYETQGDIFTFESRHNPPYSQLVNQEKK